MFLPYLVEADEVEVQERAGLVWGLLALLLLAFLYVSLQLDDAQRLVAYITFGATRHDFQLWQPLTCTLLHAGWLHVIGNGYMLWVYGTSLERLMGWWQLLIVYLAGAYVSVVVQLWTMSNLMADVPVIGASGAISALLGAFFIWLPRAWLQCIFFSPLTFRPLRIRVPAWLILILWFLAQLLHSLQLAGEVTGVAFWAHVAGFVAGAAVATGQKWWREQQLMQWAEGRKTPLVDAWSAWLAGDRRKAADIEEAIRGEAITGAQGSQALLAGLVDLHEHRQRDAAAEAFLRAFRQAADYRDTAKLLTCYLQLLQAAPPFEVPPDVHRDAGFAAVTLKQPNLAATCFQHAIITGEEERLGQILTSLVGMLEHKYNAPDLARQVAAIRQRSADAVADAPS